MKKRYKILGSVVAFVLLFLCLYKPIYKMIYPLKYEEYILQYSGEYGLDKFLVMAVIKAESNYQHDANSGVARGLMQITDQTAQWIAKKMDIEYENDDIKDPKININMGCFYLRYLIDYYNNDVSLVLAAYNAGMGNVDKWLKNPDYSKDSKTLYKIPFEETRKYLLKVEKGVRVYQKLYKE